MKAVVNCLGKKKKTLKKLKIVNLDVAEGLEAARAPPQSPSHNVQGQNIKQNILFLIHFKNCNYILAAHKAHKQR